MIVGNVNTKREAIVQLAVFGENQQRQGIKAIVDTGYTGFLTLPSTIIELQRWSAFAEHDRYHRLLDAEIY